MFRFRPFWSGLKVLTIIPHSDFRTPRAAFLGRSFFTIKGSFFMKLTKSASGILSARYRIVLIKCFLANLILLPLPAAAEDVTINDGVYIGESFRGENITITGGTFSGFSSFTAFTNLNILGGKFDSQGNGWFNISGKYMTIDSDNADFSLKKFRWGYS